MPSFWLNSLQSTSSQRISLFLAQQVRRLLLKSTKSLVEIRDHSQIEGAGRGVWSKTFIPNQSALCLYPGVYTPGLPLHTVTNASSDVDDHAVVYLGKSTPPSLVDFDQNAYILNVHLPHATGGYLDGLALNADDNDEKKLHHHQYAYRLDENPNACGQCINHSTTRVNAEVISIDWADIMLGVGDEPTISISKEDKDQCYYSIPNIVRADKSPWYAVIGEKQHHHHHDTDTDDGIVRFTGNGKCCGAVFCATRDIDPEEEILFDYALFPPLPSWAKDWYDKSM